MFRGEGESEISLTTLFQWRSQGRARLILPWYRVATQKGVEQVTADALATRTCFYW